MNSAAQPAAARSAYSTKPSDTALVLLFAAAQCDEDQLLPVSDGGEARSGALGAVQTKLWKRKLVRPVPDCDQACTWKTCTDLDNLEMTRWGIRLTDAGYETIGMDAATASPPSTENAAKGNRSDGLYEEQTEKAGDVEGADPSPNATRSTGGKSSRTRTKQARLVELFSATEVRPSPVSKRQRERVRSSEHPRSVSPRSLRLG